MEGKQKINIIYYSSFSSIILICFFLTIFLKLNWLEFFSCSAGIFYVALLSNRNIWNFFVGLASTITYIIIAYNSKLFGEMIFYLFFDLPMIFVSIFSWKKNMENNFEVLTKNLKTKHLFLICIIAIISIALYSIFLKSIGGNNVIIDALSTVVSVIATILMSLRYNEQWIMWIIVYFVSILLWITTFNLLMLIMSIACFISSIFGYFNWKQQIKINK